MQNLNYNIKLIRSVLLLIHHQKRRPMNVKNRPLVQNIWNIFLLILILLSGKSFSQNDTIERKEAKLIFYLEEAPSFPGGEKMRQQYLANNFKYTKKALNDSISGTVYVTFMVTKEGQIENARVLRGIHPDLDSIAIDIVQNMPKWIPGKQRGKPVDVQFNIPVSFNLDNYLSQNESEEKIGITVVENLPEFVGGINALYKYIDSSTVYTKQARKDSANGTVYANFRVTKNGKIENPEILKGIHPDLDSITKDMISNMPDWIPGRNRGRNVRTIYNMPIRFHLNKKDIYHTAPEPSNYWEKRGKRKFMKICLEDYGKSQQECRCWYDFIIWNYNNTQLKRLDLDWMFKYQRCE